MIFQHTHKWVIDKSPHTGLPKTQSRRLSGPKDIVYRYEVVDGYTTYSLFGHGEIAGVKRNGNWLYKVGKDYAVQPGRGMREVGRIEILEIRQEDVRFIQPECIQCEGFKSMFEFLKVWTAMHDQAISRLFEPSLFNQDNPFAVIDDIFTTRPARFYDAWVLRFFLVGG